MKIRAIRNDADHARAMVQLESLWGAEAGSLEAEHLEILVTLIDAYEHKHHIIPPPDPVDAIIFVMEQQGLTRKDLVPMLGSRSRVSEILNRKRTLTLPMIRRLRDGLGLSADVLIGNDSTELAA
ncbi:MAG: helix-turn-helix domain-containing protein [Myxococcales bacterium]|nr:helix-turn-helix domain-containing protein [Myxococcales bacterium]